MQTIKNLLSKTMFHYLTIIFYKFCFDTFFYFKKCSVKKSFLIDQSQHFFYKYNWYWVVKWFNWSDVDSLLLRKVLSMSVCCGMEIAHLCVTNPFSLVLSGKKFMDGLLSCVKNDTYKGLPIQMAISNLFSTSSSIKILE